MLCYVIRQHSDFLEAVHKKKLSKQGFISGSMKAAMALSLSYDMFLKEKGNYLFFKPHSGVGRHVRGKSWYPQHWHGWPTPQRCELEWSWVASVVFQERGVVWLRCDSLLPVPPESDSANMEDDKFKISNGACIYRPGKLKSSSQPLEKATADHWTDHC